MRVIQDSGFSGAWDAIANVVSSAYMAGEQKKMAAAALKHEKKMAAMELEARKTEAQRQTTLLGMRPGSPVSFLSAKNIAIMAGVGLGVGLLAYLVKRKFRKKK